MKVLISLKNIPIPNALNDWPKLATRFVINFLC
ncbi:hypothetical protein BLA29_006372, partial [Euroglyphus maynei]